MLLERKKVVRVKDLAEILGVKPASVVNFLDRLRDKELVSYEKYGAILLTETGRRIAQRIYEKHATLKEFLRDILKVPEDIAEKDACYIEHGIHEETLDRIVKFIEFVKSYSREKGDFLEEFEAFLGTSAF